MKIRLFNGMYRGGLAVLFFSLPNIYAMEADTPRKAQDIVIISSDDQKIIVPAEIVPLLPTLHTVQGIPLGGTVTLSLFTGDLLELVIQCVSQVKSQLKTRNELLKANTKSLLSEDLGNGYIPQQVYPIVKKLLDHLSDSALVQVTEAAVFLGADFVANACTLMWVERQVMNYECSDIGVAIFFNTPILLEDIIEKAKLSGLSEDSIDVYVVKHWNIRYEKAPGELSVADLMALQGVPDIQVNNLGVTSLDLSGKNITSLVGIGQIKEIGVIGELYLDNNKLIALEKDAFKALTSLKVLSLTNNPLVPNLTTDFFALMSFYFSSEKAVPKNFDCVKKFYFSFTKRFEQNKQLIETLKKLLPGVELKFGSYK